MPKLRTGAIGDLFDTRGIRGVELPFRRLPVTCKLRRSFEDRLDPQRARWNGMKMTSYVRPSVAALEAYTPGEQPQGPGFVKLNTNENPYPPSPKALEAVRAAAGPELRLYPDPQARGLRRRAAQVYGVEEDGILVGNGSDELLGLIVRAVVAPGVRVAYAEPTYSLYDTLVAIEEGESVTLPYGADFALPPELADLDARLTFVCHPNSPSGVAADLELVRHIAARGRGLVVVDEAYVDFAEESAVSLVDEFENLIVLRTFSKSFSLAGLRVGLAFGAASVMDDLRRIKDSYNVDRLALAAAQGALEDLPWMEANVEKILQTRARLAAALRSRGYDVLDSSANFVLARRPGIDQRSTYEGLKQQRVLVRHFPTARLADTRRITVGTDSETDALLDALDSPS